MINKERMMADFLEFVKVDTRSKPDAKTLPSTPGQMELAKIVAKKFEGSGIQDIKLTEHGFLFGTIKSNLPPQNKTPTVGFLSHFDTAYEVNGKDVKPQVIRNYTGDDIRLPGNSSLSLSAKDNENLAKCIGHTVITSDGTTLLGGDCKMGISIMLEVAEYFRENPTVPHGKIRFSIVPDEETTLGFQKFNAEEFGVDIAYTLDGTFLGDVDIECINASKAVVTITGNATYPGHGKSEAYLSAIRILGEFITGMTTTPWPDNSEKREPYWWMEEIKGDAGEMRATVFMRDFDVKGLRGQEEKVYKIRDDLLRKYPKAKIEISVSEQYRNYKEYLDKDKRVVEYAKEAMLRCGVKPNPGSIRGTSDAGHLCESGIIATNFFIGMQNLHSFKEWISIEVAEKSAETVIELCKIWSKEKI